MATAWNPHADVKHKAKKQRGKEAEKSVKTGLLLALGVAGAVPLG